MKKVEKEEVLHFQGCSPPISEFEKHRRVFGEKSQSQKNGISNKNSTKKHLLNKDFENLKTENELMEKEIEKQIENNHNLNREKNWNTNISISRNDHKNTEKDFFLNSTDVSVRSSRNFSANKNCFSEEDSLSSSKVLSPLTASIALNIPISNNNSNKRESKNMNINNNKNNNKTSTDNTILENIDNNYEDISTKKSCTTETQNINNYDDEIKNLSHNSCEDLGPAHSLSTSTYTPKSPKSPASRKSPKKSKSPKQNSSKSVTR